MAQSDPRSPDHAAVPTIPSQHRCADWTRAEGVDPIGSAGSYAGYLLVEWPLPWPRDAKEIAPLRGLIGRAGAAGLRTQLLVPHHDSRRLAAVYRWQEDTGRYRSREISVSEQEVVDAATGLVDDHRAGDAGPGDPTVLLCGHGRRDRCCGSLGVALEVELRQPGALDGVRLWRTSHTGGHRFAPTAIVLPYGTSWAYLDVDLLGAVLGRTRPADQLLSHYRGCAGLASPEGQALEAAVLGQVGWDLFDAPRVAAAVGDHPGLFELRMGGPRAGTWRARVGAGRRLPVPVCGQDIAEAEKYEDELVVSDLRRVERSDHPS